MKKISLVLITVLFSTFLVTLPIQKGESAVFKTEYTLDLPCFAPTEITFNYDRTNNHSIRDITTLGTGFYTHEGSPVYIEFYAENVDTYHFTIELRYSAPRNQSIIVGLRSGSLPMQGLTFQSLFEEITIHVTLRLSTEPTYPTEMDVARAVTQQIIDDLEEQQLANEALMKKLEVSTMTNSILAVVTVGAIIVTMVVVFAELRRIRRGHPIG